MKLSKDVVVFGIVLITASVAIFTGRHFLREKPPAPAPAAPVRPVVIAPPPPAPVKVAKPAVPLVPEVGPEEIAQQKAYPLTVNSICITQGENQVCPKVAVSLRLEDTAKDQSLVAISDYRPTTILTDAGVPITIVQTPFPYKRFSGNQHMPDGAPPSARFAFVSFGFDLPPGVKELTYIDGTARLVRAGTRARVLWDDPAKQLQQKKTAADGGEFILTDYSLLGDTVVVEFDYSWPEGELGANARISTMEIVLNFTDHSSAGISSSSSSRKHMQCSFNNAGKKTPASLEVSFLPASTMTQAPQRLTLRHLALPVQPEAQMPPGPRGPGQITVEDYTFSIQYLTVGTVRSDGTPQRTLQMRLGVKAPAGTNTMNAKSTFRSITGLDDAGNTMKVSDAWAGMAVVELPLRNPQSDRIVSLKGTYCVPTITDRREVSYTLPDGELANGALKQGVVTLRTVHADAAGLHLEWDIAMDEMPDSVRSREGSHGLGDPPYVTADLYDADGKALFFIGGWTVKDNVYRMNGLLKPGLEAVTFVVRYATQIGMREIPFEFTDIGIPRAAQASAAAPGQF